MGATGLIEEPPVSMAVEQRRVSLPVLAAVQALQNALLALEAQAGYLRTEQLRLIAADTGANFEHETWVIDVQNGTLERHEVQGVASAAPAVSVPEPIPEPIPEPEKPKRARKSRTKKAATIAE